MQASVCREFVRSEVDDLLKRWDGEFTCREASIYLGLSTELVFSLYLHGLLEAHIVDRDGRNEWLFRRASVDKLVDGVGNAVIILRDTDSLIRFDKAVSQVLAAEITVSDFITAILLGFQIFAYCQQTEYGRVCHAEFDSIFNCHARFENLWFSQKTLQEYLGNATNAPINWSL